MSYDNLLIIDENEFDALKASIGEKISLMLEYYIEDTEMYFKQMEDARSTGDFETILMVAHTLKSSSRQVGANRLGQISEDIEEGGKALKDKGVTNLEELSDSLDLMPKIVEETLAVYKQKQ